MYASILPSRACSLTITAISRSAISSNRLNRRRACLNSRFLNEHTPFKNNPRDESRAAVMSKRCLP